MWWECRTARRWRCNWPPPRRVVHSLCLIEPPPVHIPSADEVLAANVQLTEDHRAHGSATAFDRFLVGVIGPAWRRDIEQHVPGGVPRLNETPTPSLLPIFRRC